MHGHAIGIEVGVAAPALELLALGVAQVVDFFGLPASSVPCFQAAYDASAGPRYFAIGVDVAGGDTGPGTLAWKAKDKVLTVAWKLHPPKGFATAAFTHPATVILVPKFAGTVRFDPPGTKK